MKLHFGRHIYGLGAIAFGVITLFWHQISALGNISHPGILIYFVGAVELIGGLAIQWQRTVRFGALTLIAVYFIFSLFLVPPIIEMPLVYGNWGNFFEEFSIVLGGVIVFASAIRNDLERAAKIKRAAYRCFGICVISYSLYQLFYLSYTADLVPKWIPPNQMFWAVTTTIAFALAAFAILSGRSAYLASRLLMSMLICFSLFVWLPASLIDPYELSNWVRNAETLAVAGSVWILADFLSQQKISPLRWPFGQVPATQRGESE
ncbi:MAG: hypothetical protein M1480_13010 [Bacteroidetes bacterium]|nr:hypothetical protein [Bacteroidota bacterium]